MKQNSKAYEAIVIGVSAGGLDALKILLSAFNTNMALPVIIVQHKSHDSDDFLSRHFNRLCPLNVREAEDKMPIEQGTVYFAPANYHLMVDFDKTLSLSIEKPVNYSRPSIDVLFETAADIYADSLIGVVLTGANSDGTIGAERIKKYGGVIIVQDPETAAADAMPLSVINHVDVDYILPIDKIEGCITSLIAKENK